MIFDDEFNKSAVLDIEQSLIRMCVADQKFTLLNGNAGQSSKHNYYQREKYLNKIEGSEGNKGIWDSLRDLNLATETYEAIVNSDLFTYSPYTSLTVEQEEVCYNVIRDVLDGLKKRHKEWHDLYYKWICRNRENYSSALYYESVNRCKFSNNRLI